MLTESGVNYSLLFNSKQRMEAAGLAYDLACSRGDGHKALLKSARAFVTRKLTVSGDELGRTECEGLRHRVEGMVETRVIHRVTTARGYDYQRRRGQAENLARKAVFRTWAYHGMNRPGHASLTVRNSSHNRLFSKKQYLSWWPSENYKSLFGRAVQALGLDHFLSQPAVINLYYFEDKKAEISPRTGARLMAGAGDVERIKDFSRFSEKDEKIARAKPAQPLARQTRISGSRLWGMKADKVYVPFSGFNRNLKTGQDDFVMFGLDEARMEAKVMELKQGIDQGKSIYRFVGMNNCSGVVLQAMQVAGARHFLPMHINRLKVNPNLVHRLSIQLQQRLETLNQTAAALEERYQQTCHSTDIKPISNPAELSEFATKWTAPANPELTVEMRRHVKSIQKAMLSFSGISQASEELTPKAVALVEAIDDAYLAAGSNKRVQDILQPSLNALHCVREWLKEAYRQEQDSL